VCYGYDLVTSLGSLEVVFFWLEFRYSEWNFQLLAADMPR
jgi:hypothetical protein